SARATVWCDRRPAQRNDRVHLHSVGSSSPATRTVFPSFLIRKPARSVILRKNRSVARHYRTYLNEIGHKCFCEDCNPVGMKKRKERPPKDSRPKEKRFR